MNAVIMRYRKLCFFRPGNGDPRESPKFSSVCVSVMILHQMRTTAYFQRCTHKFHSRFYAYFLNSFRIGVLGMIIYNPHYQIWWPYSRPLRLKHPALLSDLCIPALYNIVISFLIGLLDFPLANGNLVS